MKMKIKKLEEKITESTDDIETKSQENIESKKSYEADLTKLKTRYGDDIVLSLLPDISETDKKTYLMMSELQRLKTRNWDSVMELENYGISTDKKNTRGVAYRVFNVGSELGTIITELREKLDNIMIDPLVDSLSEKTNNEKLVAASHLYDLKLLSGCGDLGSYKNPTDCNGCIKNEDIVNTLGLQEFVKYKGDRVYEIPDSAITNALESIITGKDKEKMDDLRDKLFQSMANQRILESENNRLKNLKKAYEIIQENGFDYESVHTESPAFIQNLIQETTKASYTTINPDQDVIVTLTQESDWNGSGGSEYGVTVNVTRGRKNVSRYFKYRDRYSSSGDNKKFNFKTAKISEINGEKVIVSLISNVEGKEYETLETFSIEKSEENSGEGVIERLSEEEQKTWRESVNSQIQKLIQDNYRKQAIMPDYINFKFSETAPSFSQACGKMVPYDSVKIVNKYFDESKGIGAVIIKAQIDHAIGQGKQFEWIGYKFGKTGKPSVAYRKNAYQSQIRDGEKINVRAKELLETKNILVVEDDEDYLNLFKTAISKYAKIKGDQDKMNIDSALDKASALEKITNKDYDIIFCDGCLEGGHDNSDWDGVDIAKAGKEAKSYVVGISGEYEKFKELAGDFLDANYKKPWRIGDLIYLIENQPTGIEFEQYLKDKKD